MKAPLNANDRTRARKLTEKVGEQVAAAQLLINRATLARALAGRPLHASTAQCLRSRLQELTR